ncbi:MAG: hypothetical protein WDN49_09905 [Acetobacteraceae bacterium]
MWLDRLSLVLRLAVSTLSAMFLATLVRSTTIELNRSVGRVWPFSLERCVAPNSPGCRAEDRSILLSAGPHDIRVGSGAWWHRPPV